jgi:hypothetical protein
LSAESSNKAQKRAALSQFPTIIPALFWNPQNFQFAAPAPGGREDEESETVFIEIVVEKALATGFVEGVVGGSYESGVADVCFSDYGQVEWVQREDGGLGRIREPGVGLRGIIRGMKRWVESEALVTGNHLKSWPSVLTKCWTDREYECIRHL